MLKVSLFTFLSSDVSVCEAQVALAVGQSN